MSRNYPVHTRLGQRMAMLGYTATDFSAITGVHQRTLTEYLAGRKLPLPAHLFKMAEILGVEPADLTDPIDQS